MKDQLCKAFCDELRVREVPVGLVVSTGFTRTDGDAVSFYVTYGPAGSDGRRTVRLEDDGETVPYLDAMGIDLSSGARGEAFKELLTEHCAEFDPEQMIIHTGYLPEDQAPAAAIKFVSLLLRMQDFLLVTRERVEETFRQDVEKALRQRFGDRAEIVKDYPIDDALRDTPPDFAVLMPQANPTAIFLGTSENRTLEALVFWYQAHKEHVACNMVLVLENAKPAKIKERTLARVQNESIPVAVFSGMEHHAMERIERAIGLPRTLQ